MRRMNLTKLASCETWRYPFLPNTSKYSFAGRCLRGSRALGLRALGDRVRGLGFMV